jgi:hypothetical protein
MKRQRYDLFRKWIRCHEVQKEVIERQKQKPNSAWKTIRQPIPVKVIWLLKAKAAVETTPTYRWKKT